MAELMWTRRRTIGALGTASLTGGAMAVAGVATAAASLTRTPAATEGPFYPVRFPVDSDADLVQVIGRQQRADGTVTYISGRVLTPDGRPVAGARVEIWQCDARGVYHHPGDRRGPADPNFQGYGRAISGADGGYRFRTIRPVSYPGRTPHIHVKVSGPGFADLTTQMYVAGEPRNARDFLYNSLRNPAVRRSVTVALQPAGRIERGALLGEFTIVVGQNAG